MSNRYRSILSLGSNTPSFSNTKSILLDGIDDFVDLGASSTVADGGQFSFSFWIKGGSQSSNRYLFSADYYNQHTFWVVSGTSFQWMNINAVKSNLSIGVLDNNWHHILIIWNPNGANATIRCFTDGANEVNVPTDWRFGTGGIYKGALQYIGNRGGGSYNGFIGNLDEFAIWDDDQSANVSAIYNSAQVHDLNALSSPPINWYRMGDGDTAPTLTDNGSGGNNGTMTNFSAFSTDVPTASSFTNTKSIALDGVDDYVTMGNVYDQANDGSGTFSTSLWIKTSLSSLGYLVSKQTGFTDGYGVFMLPTGTIAFYMGNSGGSARIYKYTQNTFNNGAWYNIVVTYDGSQDVSGVNIYVNGSLQTCTTVTNNTPSNVSNVGSFTLGRRNGDTYPFDGLIDEVGFWNGTELTSVQANAIYNSGTPTSLSTYSPTSWWRCGDGDTAPILTDNGSGGNNGTMTNFSAFSTDVPT